MRNKKKIQEEKILLKVYDKEKYKYIKKREEPDFEIKQNGGYKFGVEITEFYFTESNARMKNIPHYFNEILSHKKYRHKKDKKILEVKEFTLQAKGKPDEKISGIIQELPKPIEYIKIICNQIEMKNSKIENYDNKLGHINLIIYDTENRLFEIKKDDFYKYFFTDNLVNTIKKSLFREIYLITTVEKGKQCYFPLKLIYILSQIYLLNGFIVKSEGKLKIPQNVTDEEILLKILHIQDVKDSYITRFNDKYEIIYSNYGIIINNETNNITVHDHNDLPLPERIYFQKQTDYFDSKILKEYEVYKEKNTFKFGLGCIVRS